MTITRVMLNGGRGNTWICLETTAKPSHVHLYVCPCGRLCTEIHIKAGVTTCCTCRGQSICYVCTRRA